MRRQIPSIYRAFALTAVAITLALPLAKFLTAAATHSPSSIIWMTFQDPNEQAFTIDAPKGWHIKGGAFRMGYSDVRAMVDMTSPDGTIQIRIGDVAIPTYALPTPSHPPGDIVDLGAQAQMRSARYHTGQQFATIYAETHFIRVCRRLEPLASQSAPPLQDDKAKSAEVVQSTFGQATYTCDSPQGKRIAYAYPCTNLQSNLWQVKTLASYLAPAESEVDPREALRHSFHSLQISPAWIERQKQEDAYGLAYQRARQQQRLYALGQQVAQFEQQINAMRNQVADFERGQQRQADQVRSFTNALNGITPTIDPYGNERDVWTAPYANYWRNGSGTVVNSTDSPGAGWTKLKPEE
jgi:uncharacterized coiled-coil protein SlyX